MGGRVPIYSHRIKSLWTQCSFGKEAKVPACIMQVNGGAELQLASFVTLALDGGKWSASQPGHLTARWKNTWYPLDKVHLLQNKVWIINMKWCPPPSNCRPAKTHYCQTYTFHLSQKFLEIVFSSLVDILKLLFVILSELMLLHFFYNLKVYRAIPIKSISADISFHRPRFTTVRMIR